MFHTAMSATRLLMLVNGDTVSSCFLFNYTFSKFEFDTCSLSQAPTGLSMRD